MFRVFLAHEAQLVLLASKVIAVLMDDQALLVDPVRLVHKAPRVIKAFKARKVLKATAALVVLRVPLALLDPREIKVFQAVMANKASLASRENLVFVDPVALEVSAVPLESAFKVSLVSPVSRV